MGPSTPSFLSKFKFKNGISRNTPRIPKAKWDDHKALLVSLYKSMTVEEMVEYMRAEHDFVVNAGQLGRKLREWGLYKYDNPNRRSALACIDTGRRSNPECLPVDGSDVDVRPLAEKRLPDVVPSSSALLLANGNYGPHSISKIQEIQQRWRITFDQDNVTFHLAGMLISWIHNMLLLSTMGEILVSSNHNFRVLWDIVFSRILELQLSFFEILSVKDDFYLIFPIGNPRFCPGLTEDSLFGAVCLRERLEDDSNTLSKIPAVIDDDTQNGRLLNTDMDRSTTSIAGSEMSGFSSMRSLARRIKAHVSFEKSSDRRSYADEIPSRVMELEDSSGGSLRLFDAASDSFSLASSMSVDHGCMDEKADTDGDSCEMDVT